MFLPSTPRRHYFSFFFVVLLYHSNRSRSDNQIFHWEKQTFFQLLSVLTMSPRRRCNLTRAYLNLRRGLRPRTPIEQLSPVGQLGSQNMAMSILYP